MSNTVTFMSGMEIFVSVTVTFMSSTGTFMSGPATFMSSTVTFMSGTSDAKGLPSTQVFAQNTFPLTCNKGLPSTLVFILTTIQFGYDLHHPQTPDILVL